MAQDMIIRLLLDKKLAEQESQAFFQAEKQRQAKLLTDVEVAEKAKLAFVQRANRQRIEEESRANKTSVELARDAAEAQKKLDKEAAEAKKKAAKDAADAVKATGEAVKKIEREQAAERRRLAREAAEAQKGVNDALKKLERERAEEEKRLAREVAAIHAEGNRQRAQAAREEQRIEQSWSNRSLTDAEILERAKTAILRRENLQRFNAAVQSHKTEIDLQQERVATFGRVQAAVTSFAGQMIGLSSASAVLGEIQAGFQRVRDNIFNSTNLMQEFRESLLELAALKDRIGDTSAEAVDVLRMQAQTGQRRADVIATQGAMLGVGESAIGRTFSKEQAEQFAVQIGRMQAAEGGDATAYGRLGGFLMQTLPKGTTADQAGQEAAAMYQVAKPGGFSWSSAMDQYGKTLQYVRSGMLTNREAMALLANYSVAEPESAATRVDQLVRATVGAMGRDRRVKAPEGTDTIGTATYLQGLGATKGMKPYEIASLVQADISKAEGAAGAAGQEFNAYSYLQSKGYGEQEALNALVNFGATVKDKSWAQTFAPMIGDQNLGAGLQAEIGRKLASDPGLVGRQARAAEQTAAMVPGMGREEWETNLRRLAYARLRSSPNMQWMSSTFEDAEKSSAFNPINWGMGQRSLIQSEVVRMVQEASQANGVRMNVSEVDGVPFANADEVYRASRELASRGVNLGGQANSDLAEAARNLLEAAGMLKANLGNRPPVPAGRPQAPPARP